MSLHPYIDGTPLTDIGAFGEVTYTENFRRGPDTAEWEMNPKLRDSRLRAGARVVIRDSVTACWHGVLTQPGTNGEYSAYGLSELGNGVKAIDGSSNPTMKPQTAVDAAISRGAVPGWARGAAISNTDVSGDANPGLSVSDLLDEYSDETGVEWRINHGGFLITQAVPTSPSWAVMLPDARLAYEDSEYVTHLNVDYLATGSVFTTILGVTTDQSAAAAASKGRVEKTLDLTGFGVMTAPQATARAQAFLAKIGPRMVLTDPIELAHGQLRTLGDTEAGWSAVQAGQMIRLWGLADRSQAVATLHTDVVIGRVQRTATTLTLTQYGAETQSYEDHVADLYAAIVRGALKA